MKYATGSIVNLIALLLGVLIGVTLAPRFERNVSAQPVPTATCVDSAGVECVTPIMSVGSAAIGTLLSNRIAADQLTVNGYDVLKLQNNMLSTLVQNHLISVDQANALVSMSHPARQLRFKPNAPPPQSK
jgi:hypothetical protein